MPGYKWLKRSVCYFAYTISLVGISASQTHPAPTAPSQPSSKLDLTVLDENGVAVRSALVLLTNSSQTNPLRCVTDFAGRCIFPALRTGNYQARVEKQGFYASVLASVPVEAAGKSLDVTLNHLQEVREVVNVTESPPGIDPAQVSSKEQLTGLDVIDIPYPATNDYRNVLNFIPGVIQDNTGQPHIAGAETYQTLTLLDGFNVTQPANGQLLVRVSTDAFRSIEVYPSRESAEYGKGSGGLLGLNTGIGQDQSHVVATDFIPSVQDKKGLALDQWTPRFTVSGPIIKGKMWFFNALDGEYSNLIVPQLPSGEDTDHYWRAGNLAKVQTNLSSRNILTTSFLYNYIDDQYYGLSPLNPVPATPQDRESAYVGTIRDQRYFSGGELLETGFNFDQYNLGLIPQGDAPYFITPEVAGGNYYLTEHTHARRWQGLSNLNLPPHYAHGRHDVKVGLDFDRIDYDAQFARQPISFLRESQMLPSSGTCLTVIPSPCSRYSTFAGGDLATTYNFEASGYAQDRWLITNHLLIEPGLRVDWDQIVRHTLFSPRLAGTYVLDNAGNTKLSAGVGIVYDATPVYLIARPFAGQRTDYFFNQDGDPTDANGIPTAMPVPVLTTFSADRGTLQAPRFLNWSVALEKKLPKSIFLKAEYMEKYGSNDFVYNTLSGAPTGDFTLQNTRNDTYRAFQLTARRGFGKRYMILGSYTRSTTHSNQVLDFNVDNPILSPQAPGPYPWDAPNRFLSWGFLPFFKLPIIHALDLAYSMEARTGFPFNVYNDLGQLAEPPGSRRFPEYFSLNLFLEKRFHAFGYYWALRGGFDNITNNQNPVVVNADINSPQFLTFSGYNSRAFTSRIRFLGKN